MAGLYYDQFFIGQEFDHPWSRTVTEMDNTLFSALTLNVQPLHLDAHFAAQTEFGQRLVNSMFTAGLMVGMSVNDTTMGTTVGNLGFTDMRFPETGVSRRYAEGAYQGGGDARESVSPRCRYCRFRTHLLEPPRRDGGDLPPPGDDAQAAGGIGLGSVGKLAPAQAGEAGAARGDCSFSQSCRQRVGRCTEILWRSILRRRSILRHRSWWMGSLPL